MEKLAERSGHGEQVPRKTKLGRVLRERHSEVGIMTTRVMGEQGEDPFLSPL